MSIIHIDHNPTYNCLEELQNKSKKLEEEILHTLQQSQDPHPTTSQQWINDLLNQQTNGEATLLLNGDLLYSITAIDNIIASLLAIDNTVIIKARKLKRYIKLLWQQNGYNMDILTTPMIENESEAFSIVHQIQLSQQSAAGQPEQQAQQQQQQQQQIETNIHDSLEIHNTELKATIPTDTTDLSITQETTCVEIEME